MKNETKELMRFAELLADTARSICLKALRHKQNFSLKTDNSMVTETDLAIESRLRELIGQRYPEHGIYGEEYENENIDATHVWVLDPIDGTTAFVAGIPVFGTLVGLAREGNPFLGIIDHPASDDRGGGVTDGTTWMNGKVVRTRKCETLESAFMTCSNPDFFDDKELLRFSSLRNQVLYTQYGGSCYAYGVLASGRTDVAIDSKLDPVDVYACAAVISGAGGRMTDWSGKALSLQWSGQVLACGDPELQAKVVNLLIRLQATN
jgi:histidinol phosphatase-like enzyme (inositol monophosphatase family)